MALTEKALVTLAQAQAIVGTGIASGRVENAIEAVSEMIADYTGRVLEYGAAVVDFLPGNGQRELRLKRMGVLSVASVSLSGDTLTVADITTLDDTGDMDSNTVYTSTEWLAQGVLYREGGWPIAGGSWGDLTHQRNISPEIRGLNIKVTYAGGYKTPEQAGGSTVPFTLQEAVLREVSQRLTQPVGGLVAEKTPGGWSQSWKSPSGGSANYLMPDTQAALRAYVREHF